MFLFDIKKQILVSFFIGFLIMSLIIIFTTKRPAIKDQNDFMDRLSNDILRFHVIANSDSIEDQKIKAEIKNEILKMLQPGLERIDDKMQAKEYLVSQKEKIQEMSKRMLKEKGLDYQVDVLTFVKEEFPIKQYDGIVLPQGEYEALEVVLGRGEGHNWWCIMYPALCFTDETYTVVDTNHNDLKKILPREDYDKLLTNKLEKKVGFKILEIFR